MEDWYQQQDYFTNVRMNKIQAWMQLGTIEQIDYNTETTLGLFAAG